MKSARTQELALDLVRKHIELYGSLDKYRGVVSLHALARLAAVTEDKALLEQLRAEFMPYVRGERHFDCNFPNYYCGGLGTAYLFWKGRLPEAEACVRRYAEQIRTEAPRDAAGILCHPACPGEERIWIDSAFAVTPFQLFAGLAFGEEAYVEDAFQHTAKMVAVLRDPANGLLHQAKNFSGELPGRITEDHWSRGNGWGIYGLTELACHLPANHPRRDEAVTLYRDLLEACAKVRNGQGLWHQEMTEPRSYVETSGSALILYAIGAGLEAGVLEAVRWRPVFEQGLAALLVYVSEEHDVFHTCDSCLSPGRGTILDYMARPPVLNDSHAFGPVALAMGQAYLLGIASVTRA